MTGPSSLKGKKRRSGDRSWAKKRRRIERRNIESLIVATVGGSDPHEPDFIRLSEDEEGDLTPEDASFGQSESDVCSLNSFVDDYLNEQGRCTLRVGESSASCSSQSKAPSTEVVVVDSSDDNHESSDERSLLIKALHWYKEVITIDSSDDNPDAYQECDSNRVFSDSDSEEEEALKIIESTSFDFDEKDCPANFVPVCPIAHKMEELSLEVKKMIPTNACLHRLMALYDDCLHYNPRTANADDYEKMLNSSGKLYFLSRFLHHIRFTLQEMNRSLDIAIITHDPFALDLLNAIFVEHLNYRCTRETADVADMVHKDRYQFALTIRITQDYCTRPDRALSFIYSMGDNYIDHEAVNRNLLYPQNSPILFLSTKDSPDFNMRKLLAANNRFNIELMATEFIDHLRKTLSTVRKSKLHSPGEFLKWNDDLAYTIAHWVYKDEPSFTFKQPLLSTHEFDFCQ
ncbi:hypothetical protein BDB01DRAFT_834964 [Pilobolus umbonatus]|nr:hypothetical protein BDB01DRAFT_834964 [Pilobolus umbonatus]